MAALYLDEDVQYAATVLLSASGHSVVHARDHAKGARDDVQLLAAAQSGWILVTCNRKDFELLHDAWQHWSAAWRTEREHAGILIVRNQWQAAVIAEHVNGFLARHLPASNRLYRFTFDQGWVEHVSPSIYV